MSSWLFAASWAAWVITWFFIIRSYRAARRAQRYNQEISDIADRAMDRADFFLHGLIITLEWAGVEDIPMAEDGSPAEGQTPGDEPSEAR